MAALAVALSTLDTSVAPGPKFLWDTICADLSRFGLIYNGGAHGYERFIRMSTIDLRSGAINPEGWDLYTEMKKFISHGYGIHEGRRVALLTRIITRLYPGRATQDVRQVILPAYTRYAATAVWEIEHPDLNMRMKQFMREAGWMFVIGATRPVAAAPAPSAPPAPVELAPAPSAPPAPVEPIAEPEVDFLRETIDILYQRAFGDESAPVEPIVGPIEPMAEPIVAIPFTSVQWFSAEDDDIEQADYEEELPLPRIPRDSDDYPEVEENIVRPWSYRGTPYYISSRNEVYEWSELNDVNPGKWVGVYLPDTDTIDTTVPEPVWTV